MVDRFYYKKGTHLEFHLKVDTGMHRFGLPLDELPPFIEKLKANPQLHLTGLMTHLATAEDPEGELFNLQKDLFMKSLELLKSHSLHPKYLHYCNSAGIIFNKGDLGNLIRPGIALYGAYPSYRARAYIKLKPV